MTVASGRKRSPISNTENSLFFSLVDYRNNYFTSDDPDKIIEFYNGFKNRDQLIQWMRERPKGVANIHEVEGEKDIIVVIPTADFYGKYAKECRDNIFKGLHMVFVESGEAPDPYFNYAHNCNIGIMKAMEHNPKWIVISNDDMYKLDDIHKLVHNLSEHRNADIVYVTKSHHHSHVSNIATPTYFFKLYQKLSKIGRYYVSCSSRFMISYYPVDLNIMRSLFFRNSLNYLEQQSFMIFSINFLKREGAKILDEVYINHCEDTDVSINIIVNKVKTSQVNYLIGDYVGSTLKINESRKLRSIASLAYFNSKWSNLLDGMSSV